jgi:ketosteroid isomerase-like protein
MDKDTADILGILRAYHAAMVEARIDRLAELVDEAYSLVHITGYVQPRDEWFDVIRDGQFDYHRIDIDERALSVSVSGDAATVAGKGIFDATINGMHAPWRLRFEMKWSRQRGTWRIVSAQYKSF